MNVDIARRVDQYAGVPLCFVGAAVRKLSALFAFRSTVLPARNILFPEFSEMGSAILADPPMRKARREPDAHIHVAMNAPSP